VTLNGTEVPPSFTTRPSSSGLVDPQHDQTLVGEAPPHHQHPLNKAAKTGLTIVLKLGTSSICDPDTHMPQLATLALMVELVTKLRNLGHRVILVSSGAVGVGLRRLNVPHKPKELSKKQAVAAVGQGRLMALWDDLFGQLGQPIAQVLLTRNDLAQRTQYLNACHCFEALLDMGVIPIVNENDTISVGEIRFGDNDTLSAITAGMVHADFLFLLTDVDCLYTDNPRTNPDAQPIVNVHDIQTLKEQIIVSDAGSSVGTGGMITKLVAAELANSKGVDTIITRGSTALRVLDIVRELAPDLCNMPPASDDGLMSGATSPLLAAPAEPYYTRFVAQPNPMVDRKWWILHGLHNAGTIIVDAGAMVAMSKYKKSLFAAGVIRVEGSFAPNQCARIVYETRKMDHGTGLSRSNSTASSTSDRSTTSGDSANDEEREDDSGLSFGRLPTAALRSKLAHTHLRRPSLNKSGSTNTLPIVDGAAPPAVAGITDLHREAVTTSASAAALATNAAQGHSCDLAVERIVIGHGLVNYSSSEIRRIRGHHSSDFESLLGYADSDCIINRNNMAITVEPHVIENFFFTQVERNKIRAEQTLPIPPSSLHSASNSAVNSPVLKPSPTGATSPLIHAAGARGHNPLSGGPIVGNVGHHQTPQPQPQTHHHPSQLGRDNGHSSNSPQHPLSSSAC
ncbi:Glutamate 5-kinase, partial [Tieghemiomyces parasiticus]